MEETGEKMRFYMIVRYGIEWANSVYVDINYSINVFH